MSAGPRPVFWQSQPQLPMEIRRFLQTRLETALREPPRRTLLVWPAILGAPVQRSEHPDGIPEPQLMILAAKMVKAVTAADPVTVWAEDAALLPETAERGASGWAPHPLWEPFARPVSLRSAVALLAMTGQPEDERYLLGCGIALFNLSMFHECHDALEILWRRSEGDLKTGLQGLILLAGGFYHQQHHHTAGMRSIWKDGMPSLRKFKGTLDTPWGRVGYAESLAMASHRLEWLKTASADEDLARFWETPSPKWELT